MSKQDRAAKAIKFGAARGYTPEQIATLLDKFNLLAPDLPAPTKIENDEYRWDKTHTHLAYDYQTGKEKKIKVPGGVTVIQDEDAEAWLDVDYGIHALAPGEARSLGLALLAAAQYAEGSND